MTSYWHRVHQLTRSTGGAMTKAITVQLLEKPSAFHTFKNTKRQHQRTMPLLNLVRARRGHQWSEGDSTSELSSLPPTEESFSAGSINSIDSFVYPEADTLEDDNGSYDPYLKPLMKERKIRLRNRLKKLPSFKSTPTKGDDRTPETAAYESMSESPTSMKIMQKRPGKLRHFKPPSFLEIPARFTLPSKNKDDTVTIQLEDLEEPKVSGMEEREHWNNITNKQLDNNGIVHLRTAEALIELGRAHMRCEVSMTSCWSWSAS